MGCGFPRGLTWHMGRHHDAPTCHGTPSLRCSGSGTPVVAVGQAMCGPGSDLVGGPTISTLKPLRCHPLSSRVPQAIDRIGPTGSAKLARRHGGDEVATHCSNALHQHFAAELCAQRQGQSAGTSERVCAALQSSHVSEALRLSFHKTDDELAGGV
jgi:hypothetical protein